MNITRKQALVALAAGLIPWVSRRAHAEGAVEPSEPRLKALPSTTQAQIDALQKRVAELEAKLASQVAFAKDSEGNLSLVTPGNVSLRGNKLTLKSNSDAQLVSSATLTFKGAIINLN